MHSSLLPNPEPANIARISWPSIPVVDWQPIRGTLGGFRASYDEIEQFVGQLLDEIDVAWRELDAEWTRAESSRGRPIVESSGTALAPVSTDLIQPPADETLLRRIAELEEDRYALQAEVEFTRNQLADQTKLLFDERRLAADERASWASEMRMLREAIHRKMDSAAVLPHPVEPGSAAHADRQLLTGVEGHDNNDPVLGPLLSQFRILQRDVARRRGLGDKKPE